MRYDSGTGELKNWLIEEERFDESALGKCEAIFCQGNGYLGVRNALTETYVGETRNMFVTGTFNCFHETEVTELPNFPDVTGIRLEVDGRRFCMTAGRILAYSRVMNLKTGETVRTTLLEMPEGGRIQFEARRMVSMADCHVMAEQLVIRPLDHAAEIRVESGIDGTMTNTGSQHFTEGTKRIYDNRYLEMAVQTVQSAVTATIHTTHRFFVDKKEQEPEILPVIVRRMMKIQACVQVEKGSSLTIEKMTAVYTGRDCEFKGRDEAELETLVKTAGKNRIEQIGGAGYDALMADSRRVWEKLWEEQDITIVSKNPFDQLAVRFALYHLNIMVKKDDSRMGIGAKGLSGEGYKGHSFWDTEIFLLPYYMYTQPQTARTLLKYRYKNLYGAREKARLNGYEGAMYPWESAWIGDGETTPLWGAADVVSGETLKIWTGLLEQHISADIAFAVWQYCQITGDEAFLKQYGYEIIFETAKFWASRLEWRPEHDRYEIRDVIGPDEYKEHVDNNAYTNYLVHFNMKLACDLIARCRREDPKVYERLDPVIGLGRLERELSEKLPGLYLPEPEEGSGLIPQFDGFLNLKDLDLRKYKEGSAVGAICSDYNMEQINEYQVLKQADVVLLLCLAGDRFTEAVKRSNYRYYEARTLHDSSLSRSTHCRLACELGLIGEAYRFFTGACASDLGPEMNSSDAGIHSASMGGIWQCAVMGFGGIRMNHSMLNVDPSLPDEWESLSCRICFRGSVLRITEHKDMTEIRWEKGEAVTLLLRGEEVTVKPGGTVTGRFTGR